MVNKKTYREIFEEWVSDDPLISKDEMELCEDFCTYLDGYFDDELNELLEKITDTSNDETKSSASVWFKSKLKQMEIKEDRSKYPDSIFFFIGDEVVMEQDEKYEQFYVHYDKIWSFFYSEFGYKYQEIKHLIKGMVEEYFKMKVFPPNRSSINVAYKVEEYFKKKKQ